MDRVIRSRRDGTTAEHGPAGWTLDADQEWVVEAPPSFLDAAAADLGPVAQRLAAGVLLLAFGNAVGRYRAGPLGLLQVQSGKWTEANYCSMLSDISAQALALPFEAGAPSALPYSRTEVDAPDVLYHAFVWLRHVLLEQDSPLLGAFRAILADPHRRMAREERWVPTERAVVVSRRALEQIAHGLVPMRRVRNGLGLLGGHLLPTEVSESVARPTVDTAENRFVRAFLDSCLFVANAMRQRLLGGSLRGQRVLADCVAIEGAIEPIRRHRMWDEVGPMQFFPAASTVLHRRPAYREVLRHHVLLRMASKALPLDTEEVVHLLEVKDIARLYELWTAFVVIEAVRGWKGAPAEAYRLSQDELGAKLRCGLLVRWSDGTEVAYNPTYSNAGGFHGRSWSLPLRPDVALWVPGGLSAGLHLLDAKFRVSIDAVGEWGQAKPDDLHKMHTYRDAIRGARSAWVVYPGSRSCAWHDDGGAIDEAATLDGPIDGVGAVPAVPGTESKVLASLVGALLGRG